jgi:hypothetical protein
VSDLVLARLGIETAALVAERITPKSDPDELRHVSWMLGKIGEFAADSLWEKGNRWLGFVHGWMWAREIATIEELRKLVRETRDGTNRAPPGGKAP